MNVIMLSYNSLLYLILFKTMKMHCLIYRIFFVSNVELFQLDILL
ncbi:unnamed protein product [Haemonchus placei]|uniref:Uncharacterized protein n=1 Tax=Haemonchus placei TaxID=6290 RepID=A0A0N4W8J7_HAEPC|nr:unnamed protein product [Haemonchus placei]